MARAVSLVGLLVVALAWGSGGSSGGTGGAMGARAPPDAGVPAEAFGCRMGSDSPRGSWSTISLDNEGHTFELNSSFFRGESTEMLQITTPAGKEITLARADIDHGGSLYGVLPNKVVEGDNEAGAAAEEKLLAHEACLEDHLSAEELPGYKGHFEEAKTSNDAIMLGERETDLEDDVQALDAILAEHCGE